MTKGGDSDSGSEASLEGSFLTRGAFLLTPSHDLNMDKAASILDKMNFKGPFSLTKTATGILFKFADPDDYLITYKKGFHKVTGARFYKKVIQMLFDYEIYRGKDILQWWVAGIAKTQAALDIDVAPSCYAVI